MSEPKEGPNRGNAGKGRPKGAVNKTTAAVKEALSMAYEGMGGVERLTAWAGENPTEFYKLWTKLLPQEINAAVEVNESLAERLLNGRKRVGG